MVESIDPIRAGLVRHRREDQGSIGTEATIHQELIDRGLAIVDRARFERVREFAQALTRYPTPFSLTQIGQWLDAVREAEQSLQPGDLDPLP